MADSHLTDPLGRTIILHDFTWFGHILKGHPELARQRARVEQAITAPSQIHFSLRSADSRLYYGSGPRPGLLVVVVAEVVAGYVKTAFLVRTPSQGTVEWP